ncbi:hypothetical protein CsSME_00027656 [Camellia sinensis var. sinensis]|uniref:Uncharacterized protein n=1 Tax=Camellia sinensis TaxID=4442 RepID=A0A7J7H7X2_CAMSI|nr:hypothetical protein HYC85_014298 [Camellia sinensis]
MRKKKGREREEKEEWRRRKKKKRRRRRWLRRPNGKPQSGHIGEGEREGVEVEERRRIETFFPFNNGVRRFTQTRYQFPTPSALSTRNPRRCFAFAAGERDFGVWWLRVRVSCEMFDNKDIFMYRGDTSLVKSADNSR